MESHLIHLNDFCRSHKIDETFIVELQAYELITLHVKNKERFILLEELPKVEKMVRLHQDLSINREGIEAIYHVLERAQQMQEEILSLKQRLRRYEGH